MKLRGRRGNVILLVAFFGLLIFGLLATVTYLTKTDLTTNENLQRELLATNLAESVAAQMEAQVNSRPWSRRFWLLSALESGSVEPGAGVVARALIDEKSPQLDLSKDTLSSDRYRVLGIVKDLPSTLREYRLYLEVTVDGELFAFSWDKRWELSFIAGLDRDSTLQDRVVENPAGTGPVDDMLDSLKVQAVTAPPPVGSDQEQLRKLIGMRNNEPNFKAIAVPGSPRNEPILGLRGGGSYVGGPDEAGTGMTSGEDYDGESESPPGTGFGP